MSADQGESTTPSSRLSATAQAQADADHLRQRSRSIRSELAAAGQRTAEARSSVADESSDVWFDNLFSDLRVRERIGESRSSVAWAITQVDGALDRLHAYTNTMLAELRELRRERELILVDGYR